MRSSCCSLIVSLIVWYLQGVMVCTMIFCVTLSPFRLKVVFVGSTPDVFHKFCVVRNLKVYFMEQQMIESVLWVCTSYTVVLIGTSSESTCLKIICSTEICNGSWKEIRNNLNMYLHCFPYMCGIELGPHFHGSACQKLMTFICNYHLALGLF